eukprot:sb/3478120/
MQSDQTQNIKQMVYHSTNIIILYVLSTFGVEQSYRGCFVLQAKPHYHLAPSCKLVLSCCCELKTNAQQCSPVEIQRISGSHYCTKRSGPPEASHIWNCFQVSC